MAKRMKTIGDTCDTKHPACVLAAGYAPIGGAAGGRTPQ